MVETSFIELSRRKKQLLAGLADFFTLWLAAWLAFVIRLGEDTPLTEIQWLFVALAPLLALPGFIWSGLYRSVIRFVGEHALFSIAKGVLFAAATWLVFSSFLGQLGLITGMPRTVPFLFMVIAFAFVAASRFTARWLLWRGQRTRFAGRQALIYGSQRCYVKVSSFSLRALLTTRRTFGAKTSLDCSCTHPKNLPRLFVVSRLAMSFFPQMLLSTRLGVKSCIRCLRIRFMCVRYRTSSVARQTALPK
jgi:hypothetical protein